MLVYGPRRRQPEHEAREVKHAHVQHRHRRARHHGSATGNPGHGCSPQSRRCGHGWTPVVPQFGDETLEEDQCRHGINPHPAETRSHFWNPALLMRVCGSAIATHDSTPWHLHPKTLHRDYRLSGCELNCKPKTFSIRPKTDEARLLKTIKCRHRAHYSKKR